MFLRLNVRCLVEPIRLYWVYPVLNQLRFCIVQTYQHGTSNSYTVHEEHRVPLLLYKGFEWINLVYEDTTVS